MNWEVKHWIRNSLKYKKWIIAFRLGNPSLYQYNQRLYLFNTNQNNQKFETQNFISVIKINQEEYFLNDKPFRDNDSRYRNQINDLYGYYWECRRLKRSFTYIKTLVNAIVISSQIIVMSYQNSAELKIGTSILRESAGNFGRIEKWRELTFGWRTTISEL